MKNFIIHQAIKYNKWRRGVLAFTLIELLMVVAIIAVLAAIAIPQLMDSKCKSSKELLESALNKLKAAVLSGMATQVEIDNVNNAFIEFNKSCNKEVIPQNINNLIAEINQLMTTYPPENNSIYTNFKKIFGLS